MDIFYYLKILKKRFILIEVGIVVALLISFIYNYLIIDEVFESYSTIYVGTIDNNKNLSIISDLSAAEIFVIDYKELAMSRMVINDVIDQLKEDNGKKLMNYEELSQKVFVKLVPDTRILKISVEENDPIVCKILAEKISKSFIKQVKNLTQISNIKVVDNPVVPKIPIRPSKKGNILISLVVAFVLMAGLAVMIELFDKKIRTKEQLESVGRLRIIGEIPGIVFENKNEFNEKLVTMSSINFQE